MKPEDKAAWLQACNEFYANSGGKDLGEFMFKAGIAHREIMFMAKIPSEDLLFNIAQRVIPAVEKAMTHSDNQAAQAEPVALSDEWTPCMKLPVVVHVRKQREGEQHVSTREGITPVKPDDLIMRGVSGEEYPIGRDIFEQTYSTELNHPAPDVAQGEPVAVERYQWIFEDKHGDKFVQPNVYYTENEAIESSKICGNKSVGKASETPIICWELKYTEAPAVSQEAMTWQPINTAPKDNKRALYLARFNDKGELVELDFNGAWEYWQESWELSHINGYCWTSEKGIEEPTHWAYQDSDLPPAVAPFDLKQFAKLAAREMEKHDFHGFEPVVLAVAEELIGIAQPAVCATCKGHGMIGGPSYYQPDEGGEPCPDCNQPAPAVAVNEQLFKAAKELNKTFDLPVFIDFEAKEKMRAATIKFRAAIAAAEAAKGGV